MEASVSNPAAAPDVREVLNKYLELFQQNSIDFKYYLAPNSVIDWYGRTIRGAIKIHDYLRHEVHNQFEHIEFLLPEQCGPIESKTSHMRTKIISTKPIDNVHPINRVPDMVPLKSYADSDVEDNELPATSAFAAAVVNAMRKTPEKCTASTLAIAELTPPASATKEEEKPQTDEEGEEEHGFNKDLKRKALKRSHSGRFSYLRRLPTAPSTSKRLGKDFDGIRTLLDDSSSEEDDLETMEALYSPLKYIEVKGIMRNRNTSVTARQKSALWRDCAQVETRIRVSYRRKLEDNQIQFALIIYESCGEGGGAVPSTPVTKRNLMSQFSMAAVDDNSQEQEIATEEMIVETVLNEPVVLTEPQMSSTTSSTLLDNTEDPLNEEGGSLESFSVAHLRTPTKFTHTPPATPKRRPRSSFQTASGLKRLNNSPTAPPTPKRSAARSLRL